MLNPDEMRKQANRIVRNGKTARDAWSELRQWASGKGPLAMKTAMQEFVGEYGGSSEAAALMPDMLNASKVLSPLERREVLELAGHKVADMRAPARTVTPKASLPLSGQRPALSLSFQPAAAPRLGATDPLSARGDHTYMRDIHMHMRDRLVPSLGKPALAAASEEAKHFDASKSPDSHVFGAGGGEHLVRSLIHKVRSHAREEGHHLSQAAHAPAPRRHVVKHVRKKPAKAKPAKKPARKAARKAARPRAAGKKSLKRRARRK
ncbi:MAG: hypothetical protein AB1529_07035 [Candidatus Micrarchaeota archaeon]